MVGAAAPKFQGFSTVLPAIRQDGTARIGYLASDAGARSENPAQASQDQSNRIGVIMMMLRQALAVLLTVLVGSACYPARAEAPDVNRFRVTLLGTGIPVPQPDRFGPATLVEAGGHVLLFDAGRGAAIRLFQLH